MQQVVTLSLVVSPLAALIIVATVLWGHAINVTDVITGSILYLVAGFGITVGYHRLFTHSSFKARRWLRVALAVAGSLAVEGTVTSWVATHRRHHLYSDRPGDPHSPHRYGKGTLAQLKGLAFAHVGWLFVSDSSSARRYAPDMLRDRDLRLVGRLFPAIAIGSLLIPFGIGYAVDGSWVGAVSLCCGLV